MPNLDDELENMNSEEKVDAEATADANPEELLSDSEIERIANMNLDDIIDDATSSDITAEDLFKDDSVEKKEAKEAPEEQTGADKKDTVTAAQEEEKSAVQAQGEQEAEASKAETKAEKKARKKKEKQDKKASKDKKKVLGAVRDIFFESIEDEDDGSQEQKSAGAEEVSELLTAEPKDENERVLNEMYGKDGEAENVEKIPQKKGFFGKFKYRLEQFKKKNAEEEKAEEEAEAAEAEEKAKKKAEKKEKAQEAKQAKAEEKAQKKAAKPPKKEKPKKEKKPKEPPKPGDILRIKPKSMIKFVFLIAGVVVLYVLVNSSFHYRFDLKRADRFLQNDNYEKAYQQLAGMKLKDGDQDIYRQISVIMYVQRQYDSYENYMKLNKRTEALNALIKGVQRYDLYSDEAKSLGVGNDVDGIKDQIVSALLKDFKLSEAEAKNLVQLSETDFTEYYLKIETYGKA